MAYGVALVLSASLLFVLEPFVGKMLLPLLGGSPAVWNTCLLFFQTLLLVGYGYTHIGTRLLGVRRHAVLHVLLLSLSLTALPVALRYVNLPVDGKHPVFWLLRTLTLSIGLPFLLLASVGPLLQRWYAAARATRSADPYFLYAASNAGSLGGLIAYPMLVEPRLTLGQQSRWWSAGYIVLVVLLIFCVWRLHRSSPADHDMTASSAPPPKSTERLRWIALAFVPSSLLLGLTTYLTTDIAAVPLLWVLPLAIYLITLVIGFSIRSRVWLSRATRWQPLLVVTMTIFLFWGAYLTIAALLPFHLIVFFVAALSCHSALAASRPPAPQLTEFYFWVGVGGALGGVFNVVCAPALFTSVVEYPLVLALVPLAYGKLGSIRVPLRDLVETLAATLALLGAWILLAPFRDRVADAPAGLTLIAVLASTVVAVVCYRRRGDPLGLTIALVSIVITGVVLDRTIPGTLLRERDFFGVRRVRATEGRIHVLYSGTTVHGAQSTEPGRRREPLSYYSRAGPLGDVFGALSGRGTLRVGVVGLGAGTMAAYAIPGERWTFYELDPAVVRIAQDRRYFTYLADCAAAIDVVVGDGRLSLGRAPDGSFDVLVLDAFSSDAIPVHLLTRQALALYRRKLTRSGVLVFHLSNRYLDLAPVAAQLSTDAGLAILIRNDMITFSPAAVTRQIDPSSWAVMVLPGSTLVAKLRGARWTEPTASADMVWTDEFSNVLGALRYLKRN